MRFPFANFFGKLLWWLKIKVFVFHTTSPEATLPNTVRRLSDNGIPSFDPFRLANDEAIPEHPRPIQLESNEVNTLLSTSCFDSELTLFSLDKTSHLETKTSKGIGWTHRINTSGNGRTHTSTLCPNLGDEGIISARRDGGQNI